MKRDHRKTGRFVNFKLLRLVFIAALGLMLLSGLGCGYLGLGGEEEAPPSSPSGETTAQGPKAQKPTKPQEPELTMEILQKRLEDRRAEYSFDPGDRVDPFRPLEIYLPPEPSAEVVVVEETLPPLQKMELSQVRLVAVIEAGEDTRALVEDATGLGFIIQLGTKMGTAKGEVVAIKSDRVEVAEMTKDRLGNPKTRIVELKLRPKEGEVQ